jgi:vanillate O-demethylase monooxygenase subunit
MSRSLRNVDMALRRAWHPLCRSSEVTARPRGFTLMGERYVVYRSSQGELRLFNDRCPHRFAPLSLGTCDGEKLHCAYHGWVFDAEGVCVEIPSLGPDANVPARARLGGPFATAESHGMVFVAPEEPLTPLPSLRADADPTFVRGDLDPIVTRANAGLLADNFLDMAHFAFIHTGTFGAGEATAVGDYRVDREGYTFAAVYEHDFANREDPGVAEGTRPLIQRRRLTYRYVAPYHLELALDFIDSGGTNVIGFFLVPVDDETVMIYSSIWRDDLGGSAERLREAIEFEAAVVNEDLALQSRYFDLALPLDITSEVHVKADKTTVELRRILRDLIEESTSSRGN